MQRRIHKEVELAMTDRVEAGEHAVDEADLVRILSSDETEGSTAVGRGCMTALALMFGYTTIRAWQMGIGDLNAPGSGLWPFAISVVGLTMSVVLLVRGTTWETGVGGSPRWVGVTVVTFVVYASLLPVLGFIVATVPLCFVLTRFVGGAGWRTSVLTALLTPPGAYLIFAVMLGVPLMDSRLW
jgi:hypothetical protein